MAMLDYGEILRYLAKNPPRMEAERQLHASLLELLAKCLRMKERVIEIEPCYAEEQVPPAPLRDPHLHRKLDEYQHLHRRRPLHHSEAPRTSLSGERANWGRMS